MSAGIKGDKTWAETVTIPEKFDPANGTEIGAIMGTHLANRTSFLAQYHTLRKSVKTVTDAGYTSQQTISTASWTAIAGIAFASESLTKGDILRIESVINYSSSVATSCEVRAVSDQEPANTEFASRRRIPVGSDLSMTFVAYYVITVTGTHRVNTQLKIDAGTLDIEGPGHSILTVLRETS